MSQLGAGGGRMGGSTPGRPSGPGRFAGAAPRPEQEQTGLVQDTDYEAIVVRGEAEALVRVAEQVGARLARSLSTSQIRGIFGTVRRIEMNWQDSSPEARRQQAQRDLVLLKPKLAYQAKRQGAGVQQLREVLTPAIDRVKGDRARFRNFVDFFEAILAYHRAHGGR